MYNESDILFVDVYAKRYGSDNDLYLIRHPYLLDLGPLGMS
jgi:hypothetical protein